MDAEFSCIDPQCIPDETARSLVVQLLEHLRGQAAALAALQAEHQRVQADYQRVQVECQQLEGKLTAAVEEIERLRSQRGTRPRGPGSAGGKEPGKPPGRKAGQGEFKHREAPDPEGAEIIEMPATVTTRSCPDCGGALLADGHEIATTLDLPERPRLVLKRFQVELCACARCGKRVRGQHPELLADQRGATAHRLGQLLRDTAQWLHYKLGISMRKVPQVLFQLYGLSVTQSAFTQDALRQVLQRNRRRRRRAETALAATWELGNPVPEEHLGIIGRLYQELRAQVSAQAVLHTDDTSWWVAGYAAWLMVFCNRELVVFQIRYWHRNEEVRELVPSDFAGILNCDGGSSYGAKLLLTVAQQKCLAHVQRSLSEALAFLGSRLGEFPSNVKRLLAEAMAAHRRWGAGEAVDLAAEHDRLHRELGEWLEQADPTNATHARLAGTIGLYHQRGQLLRFLKHPEIDPTNNRAERDLRLLIIARKVSQCSKNDRGAEAQAAWASVFWTLERRTGSTPGAVMNALQQARQTGALPEPCTDPPVWRPTAWLPPLAVSWTGLGRGPGALSLA